MHAFTFHPGLLAVLLLGAISVGAEAEVGAEFDERTDPAVDPETTTAPAAAAPAAPDSCLDALKAGSAEADRLCSDRIARLRYEGSTGRTNTALPAALNNRAMARMKAGDLEGAAADLTEAFELAPGSWAIYLNRANLALMNGDPSAALENLARIRELAPAVPAAAYAADRSSVLAWRMLGNLDAAEAQLDAMRAEAPPAPEVPGRPPG